MPLELTAIRGNQAIGFMAAVGLIRIAPEGTRLSWNRISQCAELHGISLDDLLEHLDAYMRGRADAPELHIADDVRGLSLDQFRQLCLESPPETIEWLRSWWREEGREAKPTSLCFTSGQQRMIRMARELAQFLDDRKGSGKAREKFLEALVGPWRYEDKCHSWGWDAATYRSGAMTPMAPTAMATEGVAGAYWLAWESQPYFPNIIGKGSLGFEAKPRAWTWMTWSEPLDRYAVKALIRRPREARAIGGSAYRAGVTMSGKYGWFESGQRTG
jgi:hypothetical protein